MNLIRAFRAMGAAFALVLLGVIATFAAFNIDVPNGPSLGSQNVNPFTLATAINDGSQASFNAAVTAGPGAARATCVQMITQMIQVTSSVANGSICLPPATAGRRALIFNPSGQTINVFSSNTPFTVGTADTINAVAGTTAYAGITNGLNGNCFAPANGVWACQSGN